LSQTFPDRFLKETAVIALAASTNPTMTVATEEYSGKVRIPDVCNAEKIDSCGLADMIEREGWTFQ
jgi:hypothetical protein